MFKTLRMTVIALPITMFAIGCDESDYDDTMTEPAPPAMDEPVPETPGEPTLDSDGGYDVQQDGTNTIYPDAEIDVPTIPTDDDQSDDAQASQGSDGDTQPAATEPNDAAGENSTADDSRESNDDADAVKEVPTEGQTGDNQ